MLEEIKSKFFINKRPISQNFLPKDFLNTVHKCSKVATNLFTICLSCIKSCQEVPYHKSGDSNFAVR